MFSVIIPLYNKELSVLNTINSVLEQSFGDFELLVINDGSTDNSVHVLDMINDPRVNLVTQSNQGVSAARNKGVLEAKYEWIAFLDADDLWRPNHLAEVLEMMEHFSDDKVFSTSYEYSDKRDIYRIKRKNKINAIQNYFKDAMKESLITSSNVVVHKSCFNHVGGFNTELTHGEDIHMWSRLAKKYRVIKSAESTVIYRTEAENRAGLAKDSRCSVAFQIDLNKVTDVDEFNYYKKIILQRQLAYLRRYDIENFTRLKQKHLLISYKDILFFLCKRILN